MDQQDAEGFKVVDVTANTPAAEAGLAKDDIITAVTVSPRRASRFPTCACACGTRAPGTVVTLTVKGKGNVKMTLRDLV